jgi:hypothetical protein
MISKCQYGETNIKLNDAKTSEWARPPTMVVW